MANVPLAAKIGVKILAEKIVVIKKFIISIPE